MNWHRIAFRDRTEYAMALGAVTGGLGMAAIIIFAQHRDAHLSIWSVDAMNGMARRALAGGGGDGAVPAGFDDVAAGDVSYLYFSPGARAAFAPRLPGGWVFEACAAPPAQYVGLMLGADGDWRHFGFR